MKTVIFVRHADIDIPGTPVPDDQLALNAAGWSRAGEPACVAGAAEVTAVFTSAALRTKQTATALVTSLGLQPKEVPTTVQQFADAGAATTGPTDLVVGRSTTVPQMIAAPGIPLRGPPMREFDDLIVVTAVAPNQSTVAPSSTASGDGLPGPVFTDLAGYRSRDSAVEFAGELFGGKEKLLRAVSGGVVVREHLVLVSDESKAPTFAQVLRRSGEGYAAAGEVDLPAGDKEVDLESVAADSVNSIVYVTGSHTRSRKIEGGVIEDVKRKESREQFFRFKLNPDGTHGSVEGPKSLIKFVNSHAVLKPFCAGATGCTSASAGRCSGTVGCRCCHAPRTTREARRRSVTFDSAGEECATSWP